MRIDKNFVMHAMRIIYGEFVLKSDEADDLVKLLGSREEFLSWILFRKELVVDCLEIRHALERMAHAKIVNPSSRRVESEFPLLKKKRMLEVEAAMRAAIESSNAVQEDVDRINRLLAAVAPEMSDGNLMRQLLSIQSS